MIAASIALVVYPVDVGGVVGFGLVERLVFDEGGGEGVELVAVLAQQLHNFVERLGNDPLHFGVD
ncbi:MAG TPA: hypothetical protein VI122_10325, partial [Thermoleophilaceae bacterium]